MSRHDVPLHLDADRGVRQALGVQLRAERTPRREFGRSIATHAAAGPLRAYLAVDWAWAASAQRGARGAAPRWRRARGFLTSLRALLPETDVPHSGLVRALRRPTPSLVTAPPLTALSRAAQALGPRGSLRPPPVATGIGVLARTGRRVGETIRLTVPDVHLDATPPVWPSRATPCHPSRLVPRHPPPVVPRRRYRAGRTTRHDAAWSDVVVVSAPGQARTQDALGRWLAPRCRPRG
jgi:integrase/recombinase XerD